jgi:two-component system, chemotaxis family, CheB/CheR fusion protein
MMSTSDQITSSDRLVIVGSSAGGIEALSILVSTIPADFPVPIVLAQHLDPQQPSNLGAILRRRSALPVNVITAHTTLRPGEIYVVGENRHVTINDGYVEVQEDQQGRPKPSLDLLFSSAAMVYGDRLIAVILTGLGSNGSMGAIEVKKAGGTVIIQNPETARFPSMPLALPPAIVDIQVDIERLGPLLYDLLAGNHIPSQEEQGEVLERILSYLKDQVQIDFRMYQPSSLLQHIEYRMLTTATLTMHDYLDYLQSTPAESGELVKALLVTHTEFFHGPGAYAYLKSTVLPELLARARDRDHTFRCWSAGCATGEEAYSLAILLTDLLGPEISRWSIKVFATDLSTAAISFARRGVYYENMLIGLPPEYRNRFFERFDHGYRIAKTLRKVVVFGRQDMARSTPFSTIDLVLCRNVLSYFTPDMQEFALKQFAFSLFPGGYLFLGDTEAVQPPQTLYESASRKWNVYRCINKASPVAQFPIDSVLTRPRIEKHPGSSALAVPAEQLTEPQAPLPSFDLGQVRGYHEVLFRAFPIGIIVIDDGYHIVTANDLSRRLLRLPATSVERDFLHAVPGLPYTYVRTAIDEVFRERSAITLSEVELDGRAGGSGRFMTLSLSPIQVHATRPELVAITVIDVTEQVQTRRHLQAMQAEQAQLLDELEEANMRLNEVNAALLRANEELQSVNEDMMVTQEELQAKLEELETTNEELQANFEELESDDAELQATNQDMETTIEELQVTSEMLGTSIEELHARAKELQERLALLADERGQLTEIIEQAPFSLIVLRGPELRVESISPDYALRLSGQEVLGQPFSEVVERFWTAGVPLVRLANEVYQQDAQRSIPGISIDVPQAPGETSERHPAYTLVPSHGAGGTVSGVIIYVTGEAEEREQAAGEDPLNVTP